MSGYQNQFRYSQRPANALPELVAHLSQLGKDAEREFQAIQKHIAQISGDITITTSAGGGGGGSTSVLHNLLSATHPDTLPDSPVLGDLIIGNYYPQWARLAGNISSTKNFLTQTGTGAISAAPVWGAIIDADIPATIVRTSRSITIAGTANRISSSAGAQDLSADRTWTIDIAATYAGQTSIITLGTITTGVWTGTTIAIANGGTGATTALAAFSALSPLTTRGDLLTRDATNNIRIAIGTTGKFLRSDGTDPSWQPVAASDVTSGANLSVGASLQFTSGTGTGVLLAAATINTIQDIRTAASPSFTGLTVSGLTAKSFLYSGVGGLLTTTTAPTNGQLLIGSTGNAPVAATLTAGSNITITNGAGSITIAATGSGTSFADPTALVGLAAVNGSASTAMRSDAAPPLDVSISPNWIGAHIWTGLRSFMTVGTISDTALFRLDDSESDLVAATQAVIFRGAPQFSANVAHYYLLALGQPIMNDDGGNRTITDAATLWIEGAPFDDGIITITNRYSVLVADGLSQFNGDLAHGGSNLGFFAHATVAQQASGADLTNSVTSGGSNDVIANFTNLVVYATDAATIRNDIYQLARKLKQVNDALRAYGLLT